VLQRVFHSVRYLDSDSSELSRKPVACSKAGHICAPTHSTYAGANLILFCHPVHADYQYPMLTSNRSVSETEIQRMFRAATGVMCVLRRYVKSHKGACEILYNSYTAKHRTQGHENVFHILSGHRKNTNVLKTEKLLYLGMLIMV
jgi:hypothetical protein